MFIFGSVFILKTNNSIIKYRFIKKNIKLNIKKKFLKRYIFFLKYINYLLSNYNYINFNIENIILKLKYYNFHEDVIKYIYMGNNIYHSIYKSYRKYIKFNNRKKIFILYLLYYFINKKFNYIYNKNKNIILIIDNLYNFEDLYKLNTLNVKLIIIQNIFFKKKIQFFRNIKIIIIKNIILYVKNKDYICIDLNKNKFYININTNKILNI